ncbi:MAG: ABC transporter ATP-binding protein [Firmicutes bacterium]|nr:ABC transporter ATP-binding protein [Bacillota bacterium]
MSDIAKERIILHVENLRKHFGGVKAVDGCNLEVEKGRITGLIGPNGAGKTTTFRCITGFHKPDSGVVRLKGKEISGLPPYAIFHNGLCRTFQLTGQLEKMTVLENVMLAAKKQYGEVFWNNILRIKKVKKQEEELMGKAMKLLELVDLQDKWDVLAGSLSVGQKRLVEFARTEMAESEVVLLDEPTAGINPTLINSMVEYIQKFNKEKGRTYLIISHDMNFMMKLCNPIFVMNMGKTILKGRPEEVMEDEEVLNAYLGA